MSAKEKLTDRDFQKAADLLGVEVAAIKAVDAVESRGSGFYGTGEPTILFERHIFHRLTNGKFDRTHPSISNKAAGGYGSAAGTHQHGKLQKAAALDRNAALQSASWGRFQIMGFNHKLAGHDTVQSFINAMYRSELDQLMAFVDFLKSAGLVKHLRNKDWNAFARGYNGPAYAKHGYHTKLAREYARFKSAERAQAKERDDKESNDEQH